MVKWMKPSFLSEACICSCKMHCRTSYGEFIYGKAVNFMLCWMFDYRDISWWMWAMWQRVWIGVDWWIKKGRWMQGTEKVNEEKIAKEGTIRSLGSLSTYWCTRSDVILQKQQKGKKKSWIEYFYKEDIFWEYSHIRIRYLSLCAIIKR